MHRHSRTTGGAGRAWMLAARIAAAASALSAARATAQSGSTSAGDTLVTTKLAPVVVSATRSATTLDRLPVHATVLDRTAIRTTPARTLDQLLRNVSGMNVPGAPFYTTDPTGQQTRMRGVTNSKVLVLLDGIPVHDPFYSTTQWFKLPLSDVDHVEIVRGGASSVWGNLAVAGVVNVVTRRPIDDDATAQLGYQSEHTETAALSKNLMLGSALSVRASGDLLRTDGYQTTPAAYLASLPGKSTSGAKNGNAEVAAYYTPADGLDAFLRAGYHQENEDVGGYRFGTNLQKSPDASAGVTKYLSGSLHADVRAWTQYVDFDKSNGAGCYLQTATSCTTVATGAPLVQYANSHDDNPYRELGASAVLAAGAGAPWITSSEVGADVRDVSGEDRATTYNKPTTTDVASASISRTNFGRGQQRFAGVFAQAAVAPTDRFSGTVSLRYDVWANLDGVATMTKYSNGVPGTPAGGAIADSHQTALDPSVGLRFQLAPALSLRAAGYRSFHAPGLNNLYRSFSSTTSITIANPLLEPETLTGGEVGADWRAAAVTLGATWFQYDTKDLIASYKIQNAASAPPAVVAICGATLSGCPATVNFNTNGQNALSRGLELTAHWSALPVLGVDAGYTYTDSHYTATTTGDPVDAQLGGIPPHVATLGAQWQATSRWSLHGDARYSSAMFLDVNHAIPQRAFTVFDVATVFRVRDGLELTGAIDNLGDVRYVDTPTTSTTSETLGLPRSLSTGLRVTF